MGKEIITVKNVESVTGKNGKPYWKVTDQNDKHYNVFPFVFKGQFQAGKAYELTTEANGAFTNVKAVTLVEDLFVEKAAAQTSTMIDTSKTRSMCLSYAKDLVVGKVIKMEDILLCAEYFETYLAGKITFNGTDTSWLIKYKDK